MKTVMEACINGTAKDTQRYKGKLVLPSPLPMFC